MDGRKRFPVPKLAPGAASGFVSRRAGPETQRALGFPGDLVDDWEAAAVRAMRDVVEERGALRHFLDSCMKCGACTDKCHYFLGTGDPKNMPVARQDLFRDVYRRYHTLSGRLVPWLVGAKKLTPEMLEDWYAYFHQCSQCRRCAVYCPVGIDTAEFAMAAREVMDRIGVGQHYTNEVVEKAGRLGNNLGLPGPALADTLAGLEEDLLEDTGVPVRLPLDDRGVEILLVTPSADFFAEPHVDGLIGYAKVFHRAGLSWTLSRHASEAANFALFMGNRDHMAALARRIVEAARDLGASRIVFGECGHAWRVGHNHLETLAGPLDFLSRGRVEHVVEVTDELIRRGAVILDPAANDHRRVTYHDSCNIARASRLGDLPGGQFVVPRRVLRAACNHYVEMARNTIREATFCCGAGGGLLADDLMGLRVKGAAPRVEAFRAAEVTHLAAMCAICKSQLARVFPEYGFDREQVISVHHLVGDAVRLDPRP